MSTNTLRSLVDHFRFAKIAWSSANSCTANRADWKPELRNDFKKLDGCFSSRTCFHWIATHKNSRDQFGFQRMDSGKGSVMAIVSQEGANN
jgi:hypothetical protein